MNRLSNLLRPKLPEITLSTDQMRTVRSLYPKFRRYVLRPAKLVTKIYVVWFILFTYHKFADPFKFFIKREYYWRTCGVAPYSTPTIDSNNIRNFIQQKQNIDRWIEKESPQFIRNFFAPQKSIPPTNQ
eukprot:TRINITY_DN6920_c0_g1_i1.p1 TRINITY_DN6920_c0_g1~~TRINITY_DN6920_c0_g1_i1.p1  ORF type:complete len:129 (-),score=29.34 TRINITY_DN6920_c0_g1_i1:259-645(-)